MYSQIRSLDPCRKGNRAPSNHCKLRVYVSMDPFALNGRSIDTDLLIFRSLFAIDPNTNLPVSSQSLLSTDGRGGLQWQDAFTNISTLSKLTGAGVDFLPSTLYTLSTSLYTLSNYMATAAPGSLSGQGVSNITNNLGSFPTRYVSSLSLTSTIDGLGTYGYLSTASLQTFASGLYLQNVASTNNGLGLLGYISSPSLTSSLRGLGTFGYISSPSLTSSIDGLGKLGYVSSLSLQSTVTSLNKFLTSTVGGLGSYGYVSSLSLQSTVADLLRNITVTTTGNLVVSNSKITISNVGGSINFSNIYNSSITYKGANGFAITSTFNTDMYFSSANLQLSTFTGFIVNKSVLTADIFPNFLFCSMVDPYSANNTKVYTLSTFLTYKNSNILTTTNNSFLVASSYKTATSVGSSNPFQVPIRMSFKGTDIPDLINGNVVPADDYVLMHRVVNGMSSNLTPGFATQNVQLYMASTNSVFLTVQNNSL